MHPCLLYLQPAAASSCLRPARPWPPLRSPLQLRVPPPVAHVPSAPSLTRYALPPHSTSPPPPPAPATVASAYHWLRSVLSGTRAAYRRRRSCLWPLTATASAYGIARLSGTCTTAAAPPPPQLTRALPPLPVVRAPGTPPRYVLRRHRRRPRSCHYPAAEQPSATTVSRITRYVHPSLLLSTEFSLPPSTCEKLRAFFYLSSPPLRELWLTK
jgi:hypothetical protein